MHNSEKLGMAKPTSAILHMMAVVNPLFSRW